MPCNQSSCCPKPNVCCDADNKVLILSPGAPTKQAAIQIGCIKYVATLPGVVTLRAAWNTTTKLGQWKPALEDSNGNRAPLRDNETYCVENKSCAVAAFAIEINGADVLPPVQLEPNAFIVFKTDFASAALPKTTFGAAADCCEEKPSCRKPSACERELSPLSYPGGRSAGLITCNFPKKRPTCWTFQVATCNRCQN